LNDRVGNSGAKSSCKKSSSISRVGAISSSALLLESLASGTPAIAAETGGLQDQIWDKETKEEWGVKLPIKLNVLAGNQAVPYIYNTHTLTEDIVAALHKMHNMSREETKAIGAKAATWAREKFSMEKLITSWDKAISETYNKFHAAKHRFDFKEI